MLITLDRSELPISLELVKQHLRVRHSAEDDLIQLYIEAAIDYIETHTNLAGSPTMYEERFDNWDSFNRCLPSPLSRSPVREIETVSYLDEDHALTEIDSANWFSEKTSDGVHIYFHEDYSLPTLSGRPGAVRVVYSAGFDLGHESGTGDDPDLRLPPKFRQATFLLTSHWYTNREPVNIGNIVNALPFALDNLVSQLRVFR